MRAETALVDAAFPVDDARLRVTTVSMGNPHVVTFDEVGDARFSLGPRLERDPRFPEGVNVGFATVRDDGGLVLHVFERGAGWTEACGTGACAAAVAAVETGRATRGSKISVRLPGGELAIRVGEAGDRVLMEGPARHVFSGGIIDPGWSPDDEPPQVRILLVAASERDASFAQRVLEDHGDEVRTSDDVKDALQHLSRAQFDVAMISLSLPRATASRSSITCVRFIRRSTSSS